MEPDDLSPLSEITILPDGRVYAFGATRPVLEVLESLRGPEGNSDERLQRLMQTLRDQDLTREDRSK
ncbi:MAG: hypothetical protein HY040_14405 [Planctomycetes bacterium]|nr:hypothetical protein [Planctomycetota bacterium]